MSQLRRVRYVATFKDWKDEDYQQFAYLEFPHGLIPPPVIKIHKPMQETFEFMMDLTQRVEDTL